MKDVGINISCGVEQKIEIIFHAIQKNNMFL